METVTMTPNQALELHDEDEVTVRASGTVVNVCGDPWSAQVVVMVPTVDAIGRYHVFSNEEIT